jgi:hypothetical protein
MSLLYLAPDELTPAAECAIVQRLLEDGDDPNAWTVAYVCAGDAAEPVYAVVLEDTERVRAFTVWPEGDGHEVMEVTEQ